MSLRTGTKGDWFILGLLLGMSIGGVLMHIVMGY